jgi:hypothetical protein
LISGDKPGQQGNRGAASGLKVIKVSAAAAFFMGFWWTSKMRTFWIAAIK